MINSTGLPRRALMGAGLAGTMALSLPVRAAGRRDTLTVALPGNPETIDPHQFRSIMTGSVLACCMETLITHDPVTMEFRPMLATAWTNIDPLTWELKLRPGVKFHNGEPFDAESVRFSIARIIDSPLNTLGKTVWPPTFGQKVVVVDPLTVRIVTKVPDPLVPNRLAAESLGMCPPKAYAAYAEKFNGDTLIGTGPYRFVEYVVGQHVVVQANPDYWGNKPVTPRVRWDVVPDPATRVAALQRGVTDVVVNLPIPMLDTVRAAPDLDIYSVLGSIVHGLLLNVNKTPALQDVRVRQALNYAIDRKTILDSLYKGLGRINNGVVASQVDYAIDPGSYDYDPDKAKALLKAAGHAGGLKLDVWQSTGRYELGTEAIQAIAGFLDDAGVTANVQLLDWGQFNAKAGRSQLSNALYYGFVNGVWDPDYILQRFLPSYPSFRYFDATGTLAEGLAKYGSIFPRDERAKLAAELQKSVHDAAPWLFLYQLNENFGIRKAVKGFRMRPDHMMVVRDAYVEA